MPATSIDTFFACSLLVILVVSTMAAMPKVLHPFLDGLVNRNDDERLQQLAQYILLSTGTPQDWGSNSSAFPEMFGLALNGTTQSYTLDADKISRLNSQNIYALTYAQLVDELKVSNIALKIHVLPIFDTLVNLVSSIKSENETSYSFEVMTQKSGLAVASDLSCYLVVRDYLDRLITSSNSSGKANATFTVSNHVNGSAVLVVFARAKVNPSMVSFGVCSFGHNAPSPESVGTFARLSPLNGALHASFNYRNEQVLGAHAFSYDYFANLTQLSNTTQTTEYSFPRFLDKSATILVLTGLNGTKSFAEWTSYPQVPLDIGVNFDSSNFPSSVASFTYVVLIGSALYELQIKCREVG